MAGRPQPIIPLTDAQRAVVDANRGLVFDVIRRHPYLARLYDSLDDAAQVGFLGLCSAARGYETPRGIEFSTFAWHYIHGYMRSGVNRGLLVVRRDGKRRMRLHCVNAGDGYEIDHVFAFAADGGYDSAGTVEDGLDGLIRLIRRKRWRQMVTLHYRDGMTYRAIGARCGVSYERARQLVAEGLADLRAVLKKRGRDYLTEAV